jgi:hypothetical protein
MVVALAGLVVVIAAACLICAVVAGVYAAYTDAVPRDHPGEPDGAHGASSRSLATPASSARRCS